MSFKLSLRNVRKSFSDYTLYFLTLTFGVCVFYVFNSIEAQKVMMHISQSALEIMETISRLMGGVSVFVSFILGFLIVYANNFLIRRRKREFGVYMTLGMEKRKISRILISETFIIGIFSLAAGLFMGVFLSQGLSVVTARMFQVNMTEYRFVFSLVAFWKTIVYFGIIFVIAILTSTFSISKYKLIDLIYSDKQNEKQRVKNPAVTLLLFMLSVAFLSAAYTMVLKYGIASFDRRVIVECVLGAIGTFLFFASLSGFLLGLIQKNRRFYLKGLNMFVMRQINNRINTAHISMTFICLMLFATIGIFSTGIGMTSVLNKGFKDAALFDVSITANGDTDIAGFIESNGLGEYIASMYQYRLYEASGQTLNLGTVFSSLEDIIPAEDIDRIKENVYPISLHLITLSDYNSMLSLQGEPGISLSEHQLALLTQYAWEDADYQEYLESYVERGNTIALGGDKYYIHPQLLTDGIANESSDILTLVVPDNAALNLTVSQSVLCFNCGGDSTARQDEFISAFEALKESSAVELTASYKNEIKAQEGGSKAIISFVAIYVGIVFLIASAAVLALQQLSEAADNKHRYAILNKIGADKELLSRTIFKQIAVYFAIPLALACVHSVVGLKVANDVIRMVGSLNALNSIILTAVIIILVYGSYFLATFYGSRSIILKNRK